MKSLVLKNINITPLKSQEEIDIRKTTFDEVTNPYLEKFGFPDQTHEFELEEGNSYRIFPNILHRFTAITDECKFIEVSTTHRDSDSYRI